MWTLFGTDGIRGIANEAKSIPREWINAHGNDIRQELTTIFTR